MPVELVMIEFTDQVNIKVISQLISNISIVLQNYLSILILHLFQQELFHSTTLLVSFANLDLNLNDLGSVMLSQGSCLRYCHKFHDVIPYFLLYSIRLRISIATS